MVIIRLSGYSFAGPLSPSYKLLQAVSEGEPLLAFSNFHIHALAVNCTQSFASLPDFMSKKTRKTQCALHVEVMFSISF